ncbi:hypothetical protein ACFSYG_11975 [Leeuwenhoekiella polynyae]|uniref:Uncharacterized protein n=1 Tax=Leeuwenhoekiella polynyae TaxID=1550906 RepID=A0A4Q0PFI2_9FLAO|nr:hypothetical protein [Leeuwenhoekiella polynyae]RXG25687.1 hypothetical protein DSM02_854 [Leeuwenhoekiella polynyae]
MKTDLKKLIENVNRVLDQAVTIEPQDIDAELKFLHTEHRIKIDASDDAGADKTLFRYNQLLHLKAFIKASNGLKNHIAKAKELQD